MAKHQEQTTDLRGCLRSLQLVPRVCEATSKGADFKPPETFIQAHWYSVPHTALSLQLYKFSSFPGKAKQFPSRHPSFLAQNQKHTTDLRG